MDYSLRGPRDSDWPAVLRAADAALPNESAMNREWLAARRRFPIDRFARRHYVVEADKGDVIGYGAAEGGERAGRFRVFVVMNPNLLDLGPADLALDALLGDLAALRAKIAWTRELAYDRPLFAFFRRRGFAETQRFRTPGGSDVVVMEMPMSVRLVSQVSSADADALWGGIENPMGVEFLDLEWRKKDLHFIADDDSTGRAVAHVSLLKHDVAVAGTLITIGGIGGVFTAPAARGRGLASMLIDHALRHAREHLACRFGMLLCRDAVVPYYERLGWRVVTDSVTMEHRGAPTRCPCNVMTLPLTAEAWPAGPVDLRSRPW